MEHHLIAILAGFLQLIGKSTTIADNIKVEIGAFAASLQRTNTIFVHAYYERVLKTQLDDDMTAKEKVHGARASRHVEQHTIGSMIALLTELTPDFGPDDNGRAYKDLRIDDILNGHGVP